MSNTTTNRPVYTTRHALIDVAAWRNDGPQGRAFYNVSLKRSYKQDEEWRNTQASFAHFDVLNVAKLLDWADTEIQQAQEHDTKASDESVPLASKKRGSIEVAVFQKTLQAGRDFRVSLTRSFTNGEEEKEVRVWLRGNDCLVAGHLLLRAFDAIDNSSAVSDSSFAATARTEFDASEVDDDIPF